MFKLNRKNKIVSGEIQFSDNRVVKLPFFMPDATRATVRGLTNSQILDTGISELVVNTYHMMLRPGSKFLDSFGGVHKFMNWTRPILTDSGGYQVYSLVHKNPKLGKVMEEGVKFRSVVDGSWHELTPEKAMQIQFEIGSDMMVVLDDPRPVESSYEVHKEAVNRTLRWAKRCKIEFEKQLNERNLNNYKPLLFAVVQGGKNIDLRKYCADELIKIGFDGYGFGGRHIDEDGSLMFDLVRNTASFLPEDKLRFALGIGTPNDIVQCYSVGWDMFDCVIPSREGRHGRVFVFNNQAIDNVNNFLFSGNIDELNFYSIINIQNSKFKYDDEPIDKNCNCYTCKNHSRAYINHLFSVKESLGAQLVTIHNLTFYANLIDILRNFSR